MGTSVNDLVIGMQLLSDPKIHHYDPFTAPSPWREEEFQEVQTTPGKVKIGILTESSFLPVSKSVHRAMQLTEKALRELGYETVKMSLTEQEWRDAQDYFVLMTANGNGPKMGRDITESGETLMPLL